MAFHDVSMTPNLREEVADHRQRGRVLADRDQLARDRARAQRLRVGAARAPDQTARARRGGGEPARVSGARGRA